MPVLEFSLDEAERLFRALQSHDGELLDRAREAVRREQTVPTGRDYSRGRHPQSRVGGEPEHEGFWQENPGSKGLHPVVADTAKVSAFVTVDSGVENPTRVGERCVLLQHSHVGHDAVLEDDVRVATGAIIGGHAVVEQGAKVGLNAVVLPWRRVGKGAEVGAGAIVTRDVPAGAVVVGNPARELTQGKNPVPFTAREQHRTTTEIAAAVWPLEDY